MKGLAQLWKEYDYHSIYAVLAEKDYHYTLENIERDFNKIDTSNEFYYLIYLLSRDYCINKYLQYFVQNKKTMKEKKSS